MQNIDDLLERNEKIFNQYYKKIKKKDLFEQRIFSLLAKYNFNLEEFVHNFNENYQSSEDSSLSTLSTSTKKS